MRREAQGAGQGGRATGCRTHVFIGVGVLVLRLVGDGHLTVGAVVFTVIIGSAVVCYNHQLLDVPLENTAQGRLEIHAHRKL